MLGKQNIETYIRKNLQLGGRVLDGHKQKNVIYAKLVIGDKVDISDFDDILNKLYYRYDCGDFDVNLLVRILYLYSNTGQLTEETKDAIKQALLDFDYWFSKNNKNPGKHIFWTENHVMQFYTAEYLLAQFYPDDTFRMREKKGKDMLGMLKDRVLDWIWIKAKTGFCEWNSNAYTGGNIYALLNIYDFSGDMIVRNKAKDLLDIIMLDIAVNSYKGSFASTHGRAYVNHVISTKNDNTSLATKILWDNICGFNAISSNSGLALMTSGYDTPSIINKIACNEQEVLLTKEQQSFNVEDGPALGKGFEDEEDLTLYWHNMGYTHHDILEKNLEMEKKYHLNINEWPYREYLHLKNNMHSKSKEGACYDHNYLSRVNFTTCKTPDYMISCAQDFRKGGYGFQQHIWQATMDGDITVFTNHPGPNTRPCYWAGSYYLPRAVQYKNTVISIHDIKRKCHFEFTHAHFPRSKFDEVCEIDGWIFGRKGDGYIALCSQNHYEWNNEHPYLNCDVVCKARENIWICQMGRKEDDVSYKYFVAGILRSQLTFSAQSVKYATPKGDVLEFGWDGDLLVNGQVEKIRDYKRFDNKYCQSEYMSGIYKISDGTDSIEYDFTDIKKIDT